MNMQVMKGAHQRRRYATQTSNPPPHSFAPCPPVAFPLPLKHVHMLYIQVNNIESKRIIPIVRCLFENASRQDSCAIQVHRLEVALYPSETLRHQCNRALYCACAAKPPARTPATYSEANAPRTLSTHVAWLVIPIVVCLPWETTGKSIAAFDGSSAA